MRTLLLGALLAHPAAFGQSVVDLTRNPGRLKVFDAQPNEKRLACSVRPVKPALNFSLRLQTGYIARVPMRQYSGPGHGWLILSKVAPEHGAGKPVYLASRIGLPNVPKTNIEVEFGGGYLVGEGGYNVTWVLLDDAGRVCRKSWRVEARLGRRERGVNLRMAPGTVASFSSLGRSFQPNREDDARPLRLAVLLHAAPLAPRLTRFRAYDRLMLLGLLASVLEQVRTESVRLVVFNLDQQKELLRREALGPEAFEEIAQSMNRLELGRVDYRTLQNPGGHLNLLADILNQELRAKEPADAVVFLGPASRYWDKFPESALEERRSAIRFFYFLYEPMWSRRPEFADSITFAVSKLKGKTLKIHSPAEFARAIELLQK